MLLHYAGENGAIVGHIVLAYRLEILQYEISSGTLRPHQELL
jgi:hypothetical protein